MTWICTKIPHPAPDGKAQAETDITESAYWGDQTVRGNGLCPQPLDPGFCKANGLCECTLMTMCSLSV